uniref:Roadblock/LAMTOR2 domain-containing protein n=1 Tax=Caldisericum exile TaxID=693075 RepID=A0A7C4TWC0_9BACT
MENILNELSRVEGVMGVAIVSTDGLIVSSVLPQDLDPDAVSGMCATSFRNSVTTAKVLNAGKVKYVLIETDTNFIIFSSVGNGFLAVVSSRKINLGLLRIKVDKAVQEIKGKMLEE